MSIANQAMIKITSNEQISLSAIKTLKMLILKIMQRNFIHCNESADGIRLKARNGLRRPSLL